MTAEIIRWSIVAAVVGVLGYAAAIRLFASKSDRFESSATPFLILIMIILLGQLGPKPIETFIAVWMG